DLVMPHEVFATGDVLHAFAKEVDEVALHFEIEAHALVDVGHKAYHADGGRGEYRDVAVFRYGVVVEAYVAAGNGRIEGAAGFAHAFYDLCEWPVDLRIVGVAKVEAVGHSQWFAAGAGDVARRFGYGDHGAGARIGMYVAAVAIH